MPLEAHPSSIGRFVSALFRYADEGSFVSLRGFDQFDRGKPPVLIEGVPVNGSLNGVVERAVRGAGVVANTAAPAVFAPPVATFRDHRSASTENLVNGVAISVEIDAGDPAVATRILEGLLGPVTISLTSGSEWIDDRTGEVHHKMHLHWRLSEPTRTKQEHTDLQTARWLAAVLVGADRSASPPVHPLRWPGSWNRKGKPTLAQIVAENPDAETHLAQALEALQEAVEAAGLGGEKDSGPRASGDPETGLDRLASALMAIANLDLHWEEWNRIGMAMFRASAGAPDGLRAWAEWSAKSVKHSEDACANRWRHFGVSPPTRIGAGTILFLAKQAGWQEYRMFDEPPPNDDGDPGWAPPGPDKRSREQGPREDAEPTKKRWTIIDPTKWTDPPPSRRWLVDQWIPMRTVTGFYGDGAIGKSTLALQLMVSTALGIPWLGLNVEQGRVFGLMCEDDKDEAHRRVSQIKDSYAVSYSDLSDMQIVSRVGDDNILMSFDGGDRGLLTENFQILRGHIEDFKPKLVVLDTLADIFGGDEIKRAQARAFIQRVGGSLARDFDCSVVICAHPSLSGMQSGTGTGGSTAWNNTVRSRIYVTTPPVKEDEPADPDVRIISRMKNNYGPKGGEIKLRWDAGVFRIDGAFTPKAKLEWHQIEAIFAEVARAWMAGKPWSNAVQTKDQGRYLPLWASQQLNCNEKIVRTHVQKWMANGYMEITEYDRHAKKSGLRVVKFLRQGEAP